MAEIVVERASCESVAFVVALCRASVVVLADTAVADNTGLAAAVVEVEVVVLVVETDNTIVTRLDRVVVAVWTVETQTVVTIVTGMMTDRVEHIAMNNLVESLAARLAVAQVWAADTLIARLVAVFGLAGWAADTLIARLVEDFAALFALAGIAVVAGMAKAADLVVGLIEEFAWIDIAVGMVTAVAVGLAAVEADTAVIAEAFDSNCFDRIADQAAESELESAAYIVAVVTAEVSG